MTQTPPAGADVSGWAGHPRGLTTLFFTEMWERFSYYGMRAFLILYMTAPAAAGGLGFADKRAASIYGTYTGSVWAAAIAGGLVADRLLGQYRSVLIGGIIIALGHFTLAFKALPFFYTGLALIVAGTGLLKPNVSTLVGSLYAPGDARRDAGFSIFYMGINLGAFIGPLIAGYRRSAWTGTSASPAPESGWRRASSSTCSARSGCSRPSIVWPRSRGRPHRWKRRKGDPRASRPPSGSGWGRSSSCSCSPRCSGGPTSRRAPR